MIPLDYWPTIIKRLVAEDPVASRHRHPFGESRNGGRRPSPLWLLHEMAIKYDPSHQKHKTRLTAAVAVGCVSEALGEEPAVVVHWFMESDHDYDDTDDLVVWFCHNLAYLYSKKRQEARMAA